VPDFEYGVLWRYKDGREHVGGGYTLAGARNEVRGCGGKGFEPKAIEVMMRPTARWRPFSQGPTESGSSS